MPWKRVEFLGYAYYSSKGYRILVPLVQNDGFDFVAEKGGEFLRVNVKTAGFHCRSWQVSVAGSKKNSNVDVADVYLAWIPTVEKFIELPGDFFAECRTRRVPMKLVKELGRNEQSSA